MSFEIHAIDKNSVFRMISNSKLTNTSDNLYWALQATLIQNMYRNKIYYPPNVIEIYHITEMVCNQ